jgi:GTPase SAR1 family protein
MSLETVGAGLGIHALLNGTVTFSNAVWYWALYQVLNSASLYFAMAYAAATSWLYPKIVQSFEITDMGTGSNTNTIHQILALFAVSNPNSFDKELRGIVKKMSIAPGTYTFSYHGRAVRLSYNKNAMSGFGGNVMTSLRIWTLSMDRAFFDALPLEAAKISDARRCIYTYGGGNNMQMYADGACVPWREKDAIPVRKWSNTIITTENYVRLQAAFARFHSRSQKEIDLEIPHKLCIVLSGPPGFGKTTLIKTIAHEYNLNLYVGALSQMSDAQLTDIDQSLRNNSILVFEDVDCMEGAKKRTVEPASDNPMQAFSRYVQQKPSGVTLSAMLNMLDGLTTIGNIIIMTTNHPERLDEALLRSERVDLHLELGPDPEIYRRMFARFYPEAKVSSGEIDQFVHECMEYKLSMSDLQARFRANVHNAEKGLDLSKSRVVVTQLDLQTHAERVMVMYERFYAGKKADAGTEARVDAGTEVSAGDKVSTEVSAGDNYMKFSPAEADMFDYLAGVDALKRVT